MTCIPIPCTMHGATHATKATHNAQCINMQNNAKNKRNVTKTCKNMQNMKQQWRSKKPWQHFEANKRGPHSGKGSLKVGPTSQNKTGNRLKRDAHHTIYVMGATPPPPSGREHPEGLPIPPCLWKTLWITPVTQITCDRHHVENSQTCGKPCG